ncbi:unnamed protein product [Phytophthora fragariaefolia]|uniref:Unnamed protein product n=1 Tax=Phytophthora fragariaefolia TaxID=1490495 RepID=A0A9W6XLH9_9STRA|nr:unnamed protein product [Phytophthora fragariaefolia]
MNVSDEKQEKIFKKYDKDKSGYIDYPEFRSMWIRLVDVREELTKRGVEIPKHTRQWKLQQMLETILDEEEAREALALEEAKKFLQRQRDKEYREQLGRKAVVRAEDELAAALDAAGQVYIMGSGKYDQFTGDPVTRDEDLFPGFKTVSEIWAYRVNPAIKQQPQQSVSKLIPKNNTKKILHDQNLEIDGRPSTKPQLKSTLATTSNKIGVPASKYVRRRLENKRWKFRSPPRLNKRTISQTKSHIRAMSREREILNEGTVEDSRVDSIAPTDTSEVENMAHDESNQDEEELAKLFFENREFVRSLRFRSTSLMTNTGPLWGRSVVHGAISDSVAFAVTSSGAVFSWGGRHNTWDASARRVGGFDSDSEEEFGGSDTTENRETANSGIKSKVTPRSALQKMCTPEQWSVHVINSHTQTCRLKRVVTYYEVWEPPPSNATRLLFMEQVLLPKIEYEQMMMSAQLRGLEFNNITKMDLALAIGECFELEVQVKGEAGHASFKESERTIKVR